MKDDTSIVISQLAKSIRDCNRVPVLPGENIIEIRRYVGEDGNERELIIVDKVASELPDPRCLNTTHTFKLHGKQPLRGIIHDLKKGYGIGRGIITDRVTMRYES